MKLNEIKVVSEDMYDEMDANLPAVNAAGMKYRAELTKAGLRCKYKDATYDTDGSISILGKKFVDGYDEVHVNVGLDKKWSIVKIRDGKFSFSKESSDPKELVQAIKKLIA